MTNTLSEASAGRSVARNAQVEPYRQVSVDRALRDLDLLIGHVVALAGLRDPDVARPWREPHADPVRKAELDYEARIEREDLNPDAPGEHQDAARPELLDLLSAILSRSATLAAHVSQAARCPVLPDPHGGADPRPYLRRTSACLLTAVLSWTNGAEIAWWVADEAEAMLRDAEHALSLISDGQRLKVTCPWCQGRTEMAPVGGQRTWRVKILPGDLLAIICESGTCNPPSRDVTTWWRSQPCWPIYEWDWLAARVENVENKTKGKV